MNFLTLSLPESYKVGCSVINYKTLKAEMANSVDREQTDQSDQGPDCLPAS